MYVIHLIINTNMYREYGTSIIYLLYTVHTPCCQHSLEELEPLMVIELLLCRHLNP